MNVKEEFDFLIKTIKNTSLKRGVKLTNRDIAAKLGYNADYFNTLTGKSGRVTNDHLETVKAVFKESLAAAAGMSRGDKFNPERALILALLQDYAEWKAEQTGQSFEVVKTALRKKAEMILDDLDSWLPGN